MLKRLSGVFFSLTFSLVFSIPSYAQCQLRQASGLVERQSLLQDLAILSAQDMSGRQTGSIGSAMARGYLQKRFKEIGLTPFSAYPDYLHEFSYSSRSGINLMGWVRGKVEPERFIVVTAHYDHLGKQGHKVFYGADDNASGVATLLSLAKKVADQGSAHSVIFLATDAEEKGLYGAKAFVKDLPISHQTLMLNLNLDMLGYAGRSNRLYATYSRADQNLRDVVLDVGKVAPLCLVDGHRKSQRFRLFNEKVNWRKASDHAAFSKAGFRYIFIGGGVHKNYHTPKDTFENIDHDFYVSATETAWLILQAADAS